MEHHLFKQIYDQHARMVYNLCLGHLRNKEEADEATQEVFLKVHENLAGYKGDAALRTWIYRIAVNTCLDRLKAAHRRKRSFLHRALSIGTDAPDIALFDHPGVALEQRDEAERVFRAIDTLPASQRTALLLRATGDLGQNEIADVMGLSPKAVESLLSRARATLRKLCDPPKENTAQRRPTQ
jgi:RNA polymerase sigma-70 factor (ECF subfamily)